MSESARQVSLENDFAGLRRNLEIAVLIPCLNEEHGIASVVEDFRRALPGATIYVYDNGSTDRTIEVARGAGAIVRQEPRRGKGNVVRRMFADVDAYGHVNNAVYFTYFEWGRIQLWFDLTEWGGAHDLGFIVARAECDFKKQLSMEPIEICTRIGTMGTSSLEFLTEIREANRTE